MSTRKLTPFRKKYLNFRVSEKRRQLKLEAIAYKGGKCENCGYDRCPGALSFHHKDPNKKDFGISEKGKSYINLDQIKGELDKCILLCANCHAEEHSKINSQNRDQKLKEIESEKRKLEPSLQLNCSTCYSDINVFVSQKGNVNFCSLLCKKAYFANKNWISYDSLVELTKSKSVKEIMNELGTSQSATYKKINSLVPLTQIQQQLLRSFIYSKESKTYVTHTGFSNFAYKKDYEYLESSGIISKVDNGNYRMTDEGYNYYRNLSLSFVKFCDVIPNKTGHWSFLREIEVSIFGVRHCIVVGISDQAIAMLPELHGINQDYADEIYKKCLVLYRKNIEYFLISKYSEDIDTNKKYRFFGGKINGYSTNRVYYNPVPKIILKFDYFK